MLSFFSLFSASTLPTGERSPWAKMNEFSGSAFSMELELDTSGAEKSFLDFRSLVESTKLLLPADFSSVITAGQEALALLESMFSSARLTVNAQVKVSGGLGLSGGAFGGFSFAAKAATGGRFDAPTTTEIAEDGDPEYVIPVKKESIAVPLLRQLFGELSESARETLREGFGKQDRADAISGLPEMFSAAPAAGAPVVNQTSNASVQAPVSINVTAAGSDPEAVGRSIYDVAEQYWLRTIEGAV